MKLELNEVTIPYKSGEPVRICGLGDIHWGSVACDVKALGRAIDYIVKNNVYVVLMGDLLDCINYDDKRFDPDVIVPEGRNHLKNLPQWQADTLCDMLSKIPNELFLGCHSGNHEQKITSFDVTNYICQKLNVKNYGRFAWTRIKFERPSGDSKHTEVFKMISFHPEGNSSTDPGKLKKIMDVYNNYRADLYLMAHVHAIMINRKSSCTIPQRGKLEVIDESHGLMITGSFLKTMVEGVTTYSEKKVYPPVKCGISTFIIYPESRKIHLQC